MPGACGIAESNSGGIVCEYCVEVDARGHLCKEPQVENHLGSLRNVIFVFVKVERGGQEVR
jgi:hypothetical protein